MATVTSTIGFGKLRKTTLSCLQDITLNLYNVKVKMNSKQTCFQSQNELPATKAIEFAKFKDELKRRLDYIFFDRIESEHSSNFLKICDNIIEAENVAGVVEQLYATTNEARETIEEWQVENELFVGIVPTEHPESLIETEADDSSNRLYLHWDSDKLSRDFMPAVSKLAQALRDARRQPTPLEYLAFQLAYYDLLQGYVLPTNGARCLGTPGFRPHTQTYMSLTDPGDGHVLGTTRFNEWMQGAIIHVEHLERPRNLPRENIESYRIPSICDFTKVRLHVGPAAPTTYFVGRRVKDSGNFDEDFLKLVNITAASACAAFYQGAAECKVSMEGLSTAQAVKYMHALRAQVQKKRKQFLSAAWNLNQTVTDDYSRNAPAKLNSRIEIATRAIEITAIGGFDKITWDGASDTYPSKCIMYQLSFEEALTIVHEAHLRGLVTYFSAGFKFDEIKLAVYAGVDGIGIGGAQVLRYMDGETGMHGPYTEENIPKILQRRDEAAKSIRGQGVHLLARLDTLFYEGSISRNQEDLRSNLFEALLNTDESKLKELIELLKDVMKLPHEGNRPLLHTAKRLVGATEPLLKEHCLSDTTWCTFLKNLKSLIHAKDEDSLGEEYDNEPWLGMRRAYRRRQWETKRCVTKMTSFTFAFKSFDF